MSVRAYIPGGPCNANRRSRNGGCPGCPARLIPSFRFSDAARRRASRFQGDLHRPLRLLLFPPKRRARAARRRTTVCARCSSTTLPPCRASLATWLRDVEAALHRVSASSVVVSRPLLPSACLPHAKRRSPAARCCNRVTPKRSFGAVKTVDAAVMACTTAGCMGNCLRFSHSLTTTHCRRRWRFQASRDRAFTLRYKKR